MKISYIGAMLRSSRQGVLDNDPSVWLDRARPPKNTFAGK